jgi:putative transcriptional regulator
MKSFLKSEQSIKNSVLKYRKLHKMTQEDLARHLGVTRQTIISIEKGKYSPSLSLALLIAKTFNTKVEDIFSL